MIAFKLKTEAVWEITREEFMNGFTVNGCCTIDKIKSKSHEWKEEIKSKTPEFKQFYNFVFDYLKEDKKILLTEEAIMAWNIVLQKEKRWALMEQFLKFLQDHQIKSISRDAWQQLWHFMIAYPKSVKEYDTLSSWPIIFDEFVEWMEAQDKK